ncbi:hypothetical protein RCH23_001979 [Cryobacterium sp. CAN_C3]|nr:hypothetical protein [Cryobacterium sp. CAN_C3]
MAENVGGLFKYTETVSRPTDRMTLHEDAISIRSRWSAREGVT